MKNTARKKKLSDADVRAEYRFDYSNSKPNRFADKMKTGTIAVVLDPDVAAVFKNAESVNKLLRSVISAVKPKAR